MVWPFKEKKKVVTISTPEEAKKAAEEILASMGINKLACPERQLLAQNCVCMGCPRRSTCPMEAACRSTGCETNILTCSYLTHLTKNNGTVSDFGDVVLSVSIRRLIREYERDREKIWREMKEREKGEKNGKKEAGDEGAFDWNGPTVTG